MVNDHRHDNMDPRPPRLPSIAATLTFFLLFLLLSSSTCDVLDRSLAGVTFKANTPGIPSTPEVVEALIENRILRVRLIDPDASSISAFIGSDIDLNLSIESIDLFNAFSANCSAPYEWLRENVLPYFSNVSISSISVGYGILTRHPELASNLLRAVTNVHAACIKLQLRVQVSTAHSYSIMGQLFPPSQAMFNGAVLPYLYDLINMDVRTNSSFQIDLYPFHVYRKRLIDGVTMQFVMFESRWDQFLEDPGTGMKYRNLYDIMLDGVIGALARVGHATMPVMVMGTGWRSSGDRDEVPEAMLLYAAEYNERLVSRLNMEYGTPLRSTQMPITYIYGLFDDQVNADPKSFENNWGIMTPQLELKYEISFVRDQDQINAERDGESAAGETRGDVAVMIPLFLLMFALV